MFYHNTIRLFTDIGYSLVRNRDCHTEIR